MAKTLCIQGRINLLIAASSLRSCCIVVVIFLAHQHNAAGVKIRLNKNNDHDGYRTASNVARKATAFPL